MATKKGSKKKETNKKLIETEVILILDRSGSMNGIAGATVNGINGFVKEQKTAEGEAFITLVQFDNKYEVCYKSVPVNDVKPLIVGETFVPRGTTALYDAIAKTINEVDTDRDVVVVIVTDGEENSSVEFRDGAVIKKMIQDAESKKKWKFIYMGANQDAIAVSNKFGVKATNAMTYTADNLHVTNAFFNVSANVSSLRSSKTLYAKSLEKDPALDFSLKAFEALEDNLSFTDYQRTSSVK